MEGQYFYADENAQPVGPLSLDEIRRFAGAGVVPSDVMVCEAGGEDWKPLTAFTPPPRTAPPPKLSPPPANAAIQPNQEDAVRRLSFHLNHAILVMSLSFGVDLATGESGGSASDSSSSFFASLLSLWALAAEIILIYKLVFALPVHLRFTTPGKAAGFTLIPGFHLYWAFRLLPGLAEGVHRMERESPDLTRKSVPSWLLPLAYVNAVLVAVTTGIFLIEITSGAPERIGGHLVNAIFLGVMIVFYSTIVGAMRRIVLPEEATEQPETRWWEMIWPCFIGIIVVVKILDGLGIVDL